MIILRKSADWTFVMVPVDGGLTLSHQAMAEI